MWDGNQPLHEWTELELNGQNTEDVITWLFEPDSFAPLAKLQGAERQSIVCDHLGTPLEMHDAAGQLSWAAELDSYGAVRQSKGETGACPFRYQGSTRTWRRAYITTASATTASFPSYWTLLNICAIS